LWRVELEGPGRFDRFATIHENVVLQVATKTLLHIALTADD
jgi:hypothetical protein